MKGEPEGRASAGRASRSADARLRDVPFGRLGANELQSAGGVSQRRLDRRFDLLFDAVADVAVVDSNDRGILSKLALLPLARMIVLL